MAALGAVRGPWTAALVDADPGAAVPWLATEDVPGPTLAARVREGGPLPVAELRSLAGALAGALSTIHRAGLVHRDLKPSNVLLADDGPRVIDFGIARATDGTRLTASGATPGTAGYAAPEHLTQGVSTPAADVFSLGAVLAFAATGRHPFGEGPGATIAYRTVHEDADTAGDPAAAPSPMVAVGRGGRRARGARGGVRAAAPGRRRRRHPAGEEARRRHVEQLTARFLGHAPEREHAHRARRTRQRRTPRGAGGRRTREEVDGRRLRQ
ncbi:serine/threonine-protein kinase [Streptomyces sp. NPDC050844]|uniref:serine/threonine-protein kinase n=1 Tax=Streptomyces sp. NPDC050844 TaxID=3155790 RepID=UPI00340F5FA9